MKKIIFLFICFSISYKIFGQVVCLPDTARYRDATAGIFPLPYEPQLSPTGGINRAACLGRPYRFVFTVKVADSLTVSGARLPIDSVRVATSGAITGLPLGINYACNPPNCSFEKNTYGCILLSGAPTAANQIGNFNLVLQTTMVIQGIPISQTFPGSFAQGDYTLKLVAANSPDCPPTTSNDDINNILTSLVIAPNPVNQQLKFTLKSLTNSSLQIKIIDLMGKVCQKNNLEAQIGEQQFVVNTNDLINGIYFLQIQYLDQVLTKKFILTQ